MVVEARWNLKFVAKLYIQNGFCSGVYVNDFDVLIAFEALFLHAEQLNAIMQMQDYIYSVSGSKSYLNSLLQRVYGTFKN